MNSAQKKKLEMAKKFGAKAKIKLPSAVGFSPAKGFLGGGKGRDDDGDASTVVASNTSATRARKNYRDVPANCSNNENNPAAVAGGGAAGGDDNNNAFGDDLRKLGAKAKLKFRSVRGIGSGATSLSSDAPTIAASNSGATRAHNANPFGASSDASAVVTSNADATRACKEHQAVRDNTNNSNNKRNDDNYPFVGDVLVENDGSEALNNPISDDDDEGSDPLAAFSKKKPSQDVGSQSSIERDGSSGSGENKTNNPFRDDEGAGEVSAGGGANPFDDDRPTGGAAARPAPPTESVPSAAEPKDPRGGSSSGSGADRPDNPYRDNDGARRAVAALAAEGREAPGVGSGAKPSDSATEGLGCAGDGDSFSRFLEILNAPPGDSPGNSRQSLTDSTAEASTQKEEEEDGENNGEKGNEEKKEEAAMERGRQGAQHGPSVAELKDDDFPLGRKAGRLPQDSGEETPPIPKPLLSATNPSANSCGDIPSNEASTNPLTAKEPGDGAPAASARSEMPPPIPKPLLSLAPAQRTPRRPAVKDNVAAAILGSSSVRTARPILPSIDEDAVKDLVSPPSPSGTSGGATGLEEFLVRTKDQTDQSGWQEELLMITRSQTDEWLDKVYGSETSKNQSSDGKISTSLCEDVFYFFRIQLRTFCELLSENSDALVLAVVVILSHMRTKQVHARDDLLLDLETCCAASNDFARMSEKCEEMISELISQREFSEDSVATLEASSDALMGVYSSDAVYAARSVHIHVFKPIEEELGVRLFEKEWEETLAKNELAVCLVQTLEDFREDLERYMDHFMSVKSMISLMSATVIFYVKCLLQRAEKHRNDGDGERPFFVDVKKALDRMSGDIQVIRDYFEGLVPKIPPLKNNIAKDFEILDTIHELMSVAAGYSVSDAADFILVLQTQVRDVGIVKHIVGDLWHLVARTERRNVWKILKSMEEQLTLIASVDDNFALEDNDRSYVKGLRLDEMAMKMYDENRRNKPAAVDSNSVVSVCRHLSEEYRMRIKPQISASKSQLSEEYKTRVKPQISASTSHLNQLGLTGLRRMRSEWEVSKEKLQKIVRD